MRKSIRIQFVSIVIGMLAGTLVLCWILNTAFLDKYYIRNKNQIVQEAYKKINAAGEDGSLQTQAFQEQMRDYAFRYNTNMIVINSNPEIVLLATFDDKELNTRLLGYIMHMGILVHNLIFADKETNEILILNWYKWNWTKSPKILTMIDKELNSLKSTKLVELLEERIGMIFGNKDTVSIGYRYPTNSISNNISIVTNEEIDNYFDKIYSIYPRKVSKVQAKETFEHKFRGLEKEEAYKKAIAIYRMLENQNQVWQAENEGQGRKVEFISHFSTWLNDNVENSPHFKKGRKR